MRIAVLIVAGLGLCGAVASAATFAASTPGDRVTAGSGRSDLMAADIDVQQAQSAFVVTGTPTEAELDSMALLFQQRFEAVYSEIENIFATTTLSTEDAELLAGAAVNRFVPDLHAYAESLEVAFAALGPGQAESGKELAEDIRALEIRLRDKVRQRAEERAQLDAIARPGRPDGTSR